MISRLAERSSEEGRDIESLYVVRRCLDGDQDPRVPIWPVRTIIAM
jgi:hypothetical protein